MALCIPPATLPPIFCPHLMALGIALPMADPIAAPIGAASGPRKAADSPPPTTAPIPLPSSFCFFSGLCSLMPLTMSIPAAAADHPMPKMFAPLPKTLANLPKKPVAPLAPVSSAVPVSPPSKLENIP